MRGRGWVPGLLAAVLLGRVDAVDAAAGLGLSTKPETAESGAAQAMAATGTRPALGACLRAVLEGEVRSGQEFRRGFGGGLDLVIEPIASGWVVRVLPARGQRPAVDYAGIATPPYRSVSPLLVSTDFSFRAQDAVGWNPRRFRYAADTRAFGAMEVVYQRLTGGGRAGAQGGSPHDEEVLAGLASGQPGGVLEILDAGLTPGTADQTRAAGLVASHFGTTAHRLEQPEAGRATALGRIGWMRFRVRLELPRGDKPVHGVKVESYVCGRG